MATFLSIGCPSARVSPQIAGAISMTAKSLSTELHEQFQVALEELDSAKQAMLNTLGALGRPTTPEKLAAFSKAKDAMDKAAAKCSQIAQKIAEL
ncbi:hypothetical protein [Bradyrhizobium sp. SZCCHNR1047]|uniref:hypothetical protein n=2 Tax=unclassified Bradyrhizobium TaxID=2631580 RepID=UPI0029168201|nr:hypothetical protein [Bradyrhizobium sp. SZCCHNR1047]